MEALLHFITGLGVLAILFVIFAESGLLIGFFLPGDSLLFTAGFLVQKGLLPIDVHLFVLLLWVAAVIGDSVGYSFGRRVGRKLFERKNSRIFRKEHLIQAEAFYKKHGPLAIVLARFVPIVRTFAPIIAGVGSMKYKQFLTYNIIGGGLWVAIFTYLGFFAGKKLTEMGVNIEVAAIVIIVLSVSPMLYHALKTKAKRQALVAAIKREINIIFKGKKA